MSIEARLLMTSWLLAIAFWFVIPLAAGVAAGNIVRRIAAKPSTILPEIVAALTAPLSLLALHALLAAPFDAASRAVGYPDVWGMNFVVPALVAQFVAAAILTLLFAPEGTAARTD